MLFVAHWDYYEDPQLLKVQSLKGEPRDQEKKGRHILTAKNREDCQGIASSGLDKMRKQLHS